MSSRARIGTALGGLSWIVFGAVLLSFSQSPGAGDSCHPHALWTGAWFFVPPLMAIGGLLLTAARSSRRRVGLTANALLLVLWGAAAFPLWVLAAIAHGATCGGG